MKTRTPIDFSRYIHKSRVVRIKDEHRSSLLKRRRNAFKIAGSQGHETDLHGPAAPNPVTPLWRGCTPLHANDLNSDVFY
jgi:hypothetical protein